jgi:hypothetical protein
MVQAYGTRWAFLNVVGKHNMATLRNLYEGHEDCAYTKVARAALNFQKEINK